MLRRWRGKAFWPAGVLAIALMAALAAMAAPATAACGSRYLVHSAGSYSDQELKKARNGTFRIHRYTLRLRPPVNWARDPESSRRFRAALASLTWLDALFYDYIENDRGASLRKAGELALDWIGANPLSDPASDRTWDDRVSATRAPYLAYAMRALACAGALAERKEETFRRSVLAHGRLAASNARYRPTNHGLFVDTNLILLARSVPRLAAGRDWEQTGTRRFKRTLRGRIIEEEGFWLEHSATYQLAIRRELGFYRDLVGGRALAGLFNRMTEISGWLVEPDEELWLLGSSNYRRVAPEIRAEAAAGDGLRWLPRSGLAFVKRSGGYLGAAATYFNASHKHSDDLSFELFDHDLRIVSDSGQYDKDPGRWNRFQRSPEAHATLTVDGQPFERRGGRTYGSGMIARGEGEGWFAILARNPLLGEQGVSHQRLLLYRPAVGLIVLDRVRSSRRHSYRRFFQLGTGIDAAIDPGGVALSSGSWSGRLSGPGPDGPAQITLLRGQRRPAIRGFEFPAFRETVPRYVAELRDRAEDLDALAVLATDPAQRLEATLVSSGGPGDASIALEIANLPAGTLNVTRSGGSLIVSVD